MAMNPIPPQAYTKESMLKAYAWLQNQDASIKEMATTPDILVSLFLKANRDGEGALDRPSIQNFKHELKQLAGLMGEFDKERPVVPNQTLKTGESNLDSKTRALEGVGLNAASKREGYAKPLESLSIDFPSLEKKFNASLNPATQATSPSALGLDFDIASVTLINEVRQKLNLSSNTEALKVLIQVGYNKIKKLL